MDDDDIDRRLREALKGPPSPPVAVVRQAPAAAPEPTTAPKAVTAPAAAVAPTNGTDLAGEMAFLRATLAAQNRFLEAISTQVAQLAETQRSMAEAQAALVPSSEGGPAMDVPTEFVCSTCQGESLSERLRSAGQSVPAT